MTPERAQDIVVAAVKDGFKYQGDAGKEVTPETEVYGPNSDLDSLGFISAILGVEDALRAEKITMSLNPDGSFDPVERYATVATFAAYVAANA